MMFSEVNSETIEEWDKYRRGKHKGRKWLLCFIELEGHIGWGTWAGPELETQNLFELFFEYPLPDVENYCERTHFVGVMDHNNNLMKKYGWDKHPTTEKRYIERCDQIYEHMGGRKYIVL